MKNHLLGLLGLGLVACGAADDEGGSSARSASSFDGSFSISDSFGGGFDSNGDRPEARFVQPDLIDLRTRGGQVRVHVGGLPDSGSGETNDFLRNNTMYTTTVEIDGVEQRVGCKPGDPIKGRFVRTALSAERISGEFEFEVTVCEDYMTGEVLEIPGLPMTVSGRFEALALSQ